MPPRPKRASRPVIEKSVTASTRRAAVVLGERVDDRRARPALAALVGAARLQRRGVGALVGALDLDRAAVGRGRRAELDLERAVVGAVVVVVGDRRAGQAGRDALEVVERRPHLIDRRRHLEGLLELHDWTSWSRSGVSMSVGSHSRPTSHVYTWSPSSRPRAPVSPSSSRDVVEQPPLEQHRVARVAVVGRAHGEVAAAVVEHAGDHLGADEGLVAERDDRRLDVAERGHAGLQRGGLAVGPLLADDDVGAAEVDCLLDLRRRARRGRPRPARSTAPQASSGPRARAAAGRRGGRPA